MGIMVIYVVTILPLRVCFNVGRDFDSDWWVGVDWVVDITFLIGE